MTLISTIWWLHRLVNFILFLRFLRISPEMFDHLLSLATSLISKKDTKLRKTIPSNKRLALTLRFLASGELQISLSFQFGLGRVTVSNIIYERCEIIYQVLSEKYLRSPRSPEERKTIAQQFEDTWNMPHIIRVVDGKHIPIKCPKKHWDLIPQLQGILLVLLYKPSTKLITFLIRRWSLWH